MTVYYHWNMLTEYINAYPNENTEEGKYMILSGERRDHPQLPHFPVGKWLSGASNQSYVKEDATRITEQEAKALVRKNKLCRIADKISAAF